MTASATDFDLAAWSAGWRDAVERSLDDWVPPDAPAQLGQAMRYAVLDGGKRLRPLLLAGTAEAVHGTTLPPAIHTGALRAACALELMHAYSLVHDDLPCMDNDVLRRGKPTVHVQYGQALALLAGDALQALAFELLVPEDRSLSPWQSAMLCRQLAVAAGRQGMAGGQAIDLAAVAHVLTQDQLEDMHRRKTGALLLASITMGVTVAAPLAPSMRWEALRAYGRVLGLAFQVVDDILDVTADSATLGKTAGKDAAAAKPTFVSLLGLAGAQAYAHNLLQQAHAHLDGSHLRHAQALHALADWVVHRSR